MISFSPQDDFSASVLDNHLSIQAAAEYSGYNVQYLRRLVQSKVIKAVKIGQMWLVAVDSLNDYLKSVREAGDRRFGPRVYQEYVESLKG